MVYKDDPAGGSPQPNSAALSEASQLHSAPPTDPEALKAKESKVSYKNLPHKGQLAILCIARLADPLATTSIQTYMFYQLKFFNPGISPELLATQAGILVGAKTAAQVCTGMLWGRLADSELGGRKVVLMIGLLSSGIACLGYGFSRNFVSAIAWQVFGGAMSSNIAIIRCTVAELNPEKRYRTRALLLLPLFASAGQLIGPLVGGLLSSQDGNDRGYPYAPPNIFVAIIYAIAATGIFFGLEETLDIIKQHPDGSYAQRLWKRITPSWSKQTGQEYTAIASDDTSPDTPTVELSPSSPTPMNSQVPLLREQNPKTSKPKLPFLRIWTPNVLCTLLAHFIVAGHLGTFTNLWAIFLSTPVEKSAMQHPTIYFNGGLGMLPREVGFAMSILGTVGVILQLVIYPMLNDRFGTVNIWQVALFIFPIVYILAPFLSLAASANENGGSTVFVWMWMLFVLLLFVIGRTGVTPATTLLINDCTPHPSVRGTVHTAGTVIGNLSRSIFPIAAFAIFGQGIEIGVVGLGFWCLAGLAVLACLASRWVREGSNGREIVLEGDVPVEETRAEPVNPGK